MHLGEVWFATTPGGDRPVLVSELDLTAAEDGVPTDCVVNFDNLHTLPRTAFRRRVVALSAVRMAGACRTLRDSLGC